MSNPSQRRARYTHDFELVFAVDNNDPTDVTNDELWVALNDRIAALRRNPDSLIGELWPPRQTIDHEASEQGRGEQTQPKRSGFRNFYRCINCQHEWNSVWQHQVDDDCPNCGERHVSPYKFEDV